MKYITLFFLTILMGTGLVNAQELNPKGNGGFVYVAPAGIPINDAVGKPVTFKEVLNILNKPDQWIRKHIW